MCAGFRKCAAPAVALLAILVAGEARAAQTCPPLQVRNPEGNYIVPGSLGDIPYAEGLALDAYVQEGGRRRPSVIVVHGGGWTAGSRAAHVGQLLELVTRAGYNWFSVDYRLDGLARYEEALADLRSAARFVRCRAGDLGIDPDRLVLLGEDAGAHLAALLASERPPGLIGAVLVGGAYDLTGVRGISETLPPDLLERASPIRRVPPGMPPVLVVHGGADAEVPADQARRFCAAVSKAGRCRFVEVAGASHRSENWWPSQWGYKREVVEWMGALHGGGTLTYQPRRGAVRKDVVFGERPELRLDAYVPQSARPVPAVIIVHGGGWEAGDKVTYVTPLFEPLARARLAWFSIDYRLTPEVTHPEQLADLRSAIAFVRRQHARFNVDPARIFLLGESASGQMVAQIAAEDPSLAGVIAFYGVYDFLPMVTDASPRSLLVRLFRRYALDDEARSILRSHSPLYRAHRDMPPMLLVNGTGERLWVQAQTYARRLSEIGARHEAIVLSDAPHGLENWEGRPAWTTYKRGLVEWIQRIAR